jgi:aquaporin Z
VTEPVIIADEAIATPSLGQRLAAEVFGTFVLVFSVIGAALFASPTFGLLSVALAVGLAVMAAAYAVGHISGGHFNPAVTIGAAASGRFAWRDVLPYIIAQIVGGAIATSILFGIAAGGPAKLFSAEKSGGFASNGFGDHSPNHYGLISVLVIEIVLTALFLWVILGATDRRAPSGFAPIAIGLALTVIHIVAIPVSNASVNPARSIATAIYGGGDAWAQLWVFIVAPIVGALIAGFTYTPLFDRKGA